jgi:CheY-like chemotaxis protein
VSKSEKQHQILFVDDDPDFLRLIQETFGMFSAGGWQVHGVSSADAALERLKQKPMDLVVVDINMPMLDGLQLLRILGRRYPNLKKVTLTAYPSDEKRAECLANGAEFFIEKPRSIDGFKAIYVMLDELLSWAPATGFQGVLRHVGLQDVIQMECLGRNSSILEIHNQQVRGTIFIEDGSIIHAVLGEDTGEKAFQNLLTLSSGQFQLQPFKSPGVRTIQGNWESLLMEAAQVRDEMSANQPATGATPDSSNSMEENITLDIAVRETLVCSAQGKPLYLWQCHDVLDRVALLQNIAQQTELLTQTLPLGKFERLEILQPDRRAVAIFGPDRMVFVRAIRAGNPAVT